MFISRWFLHLQVLLPLLGSSLQPESASSFWNQFYFSSSFCLQTLNFPTKSLPSVFQPTESLDADAQCSISHVFCSSFSCLFIIILWKIQDKTILFKLVTVKIYNKPIPVAASKQQASAWEFICSGLDICSPPHHTHRDYYLPPVRICSICSYDSSLWILHNI